MTGIATISVIETVLDIPVPPSVNETRRVNWAAMPKYDAWKKSAGKILMANGQFKRAQKFTGPFELTIILNEATCDLDADNPVKAAVDFLRRIEIIRNDDKRYLRSFTVKWGDAPEGCRLILREAA